VCGKGHYGDTHCGENTQETQGTEPELCRFQQKINICQSSTPAPEYDDNNEIKKMFEERFIVGSDSAADDEDSIEDEEEEMNDYAGLDEEVVSGLLGLTDINT
jgi:hypothetical protein